MREAILSTGPPDLQVRWSGEAYFGDYKPLQQGLQGGYNAPLGFLSPASYGQIVSNLSLLQFFLKWIKYKVKA